MTRTFANRFRDVLSRSH